MINFILQVLLFQVLFLAVYDFFLHKETFFKWNRLYLLITPIVSFIIPFLKFESLQKSVSTQYVEQLPTVFLNPEAVLLQSVELDASIGYLKMVFYIGIVFFSMLFLLKLFKIIKLISNNEVIKKEQFKLVLLNKTASAFSFFNYIFIKKEFIDKKEFAIIQHELVHCKQLHTLDLLYFEFLKISMWFNPFIYVYQNRITLLHEYISDAEVLKETDKKSYFNAILSETFNVENISFTNQFYKHSLIKKRITMITKSKSQKIKQLKYLLLIPLLFGMLIYTSCTDEVQNNIEQIESVLKEKNIPSEGKYFRTDNGFIIFIGTHLEGTTVPFEQFTSKEKEVFNKIEEKGNNTTEMSVVIDTNGDRVCFIKTKYFNKTDDTSVDDDGTMSFSKIDNVPVFPGCEGTEAELRVCFQEKITDHVAKNFNSNLANGLGLTPGIIRIFVMFTVDKNGTITDVKARAPHTALEEEAIRVVNNLPKMKPSSYKNKIVGVKYTLPIAFNVAGDATTNSESTATSETLPDNVLYIVDGKEINKVALKKITPDKIASLNVLKDDNAIKKYGEKGKNGVVEIILKK